MVCLYIFSDTENGGPVHWIHEPYVCPNCLDMSKVRGRDRNCCINKSNAYNDFGNETTFCSPDGIRGDNATHHISMGIKINHKENENRDIQLNMNKSNQVISKNRIQK